MKRLLLSAAALAAFAASAGDAAGNGKEDPSFADELSGRLSFNASAAIESAYICRGKVYDSRPYSAQSASAGVDLKPFGVVEAAVWTYSAMSHGGFSSQVSRYAYAESDYLLRWYYGIDLAEGWRLKNGLGRQWVTNPGFRGGRTVCDWQALQVLDTPWVSPYWRLRVIRRPFEETYWVAGVKRSFGLVDGLSLTVDFFGDLGDRRHFANIYGTRSSGGWRGGLQALNLVFRLDWRLTDHVSLFGFVGQFGLVSDDARGAIKAARGPEARRDLTYGGLGVSVGF